jgi:hypothetical protein
MVVRDVMMKVLCFSRPLMGFDEKPLREVKREVDLEF